MAVLLLAFAFLHCPRLVAAERAPHAQRLCSQMVHDTILSAALLFPDVVSRKRPLDFAVTAVALVDQHAQP